MSQPKVDELEPKAIAALETALAQTRADLAAGRIVRESPEAHLVRIKSESEILPLNTGNDDAVY